MAKKKEVIITCNATNVKAVIEGLERGMAALAQEEEKLLNVIKQRGYAENDEKKRLKELEKAMDAMRANVQKNREEQKKLGEVMKDLAGAKLKDLKKALQEGKAALNNMSERDPKRKQLVDDLQRIQRQIDKNTGATNKLNTANKGLSATLATTAKNLATYMIGCAGFNKVKSLIEDVFKANIKLSDSLANIRKVSGLSGEAINQLYRNLSQIDTRNTIEMLNQLAYTGAKLGIGQNYGVEGLTGFVKAAEQVQMALGEDMGEKALPELSKMVEVMGLIPKYGVEQAMQKAASAIFQLGATSTATGSNIVEFSKRLMGLANVSRVSTQDLLALGSASDAMGLMPEVSATAFNKLFTSIQRQHNLIEDSLGLTKGTIKSLYDEGKTMDAIVMIFEKMNEKGNLNLLGSIFKDLGSDGARLVNVMATMADRADILRKHLETSRDAFKEGEAVIGEYMIQNQTAAALVERASNLWAKAFTNPEGVDMVKEMAQAWYDLSKQMTQSEALMWSLHSSIDAIATSIGILIKLFPVLLRYAMVFVATLGLRGIGLAITNIGGLATAFRALTKDIMLASGAAAKFNVVLKSNAILFAASAIATAITLVMDYSKAAEEAAKREQERQAKLKAAFENSKEAVEKVVKPLETYKKALDDATLSEKQRAELLKQFKTDYQDYLDYLGIEINSAVDLAKAYAQVVRVMKQKKAYEEREEYRTQQNGENRMSRIENQAKVEAAARSFGIEGIDKAFLEQNQSKGTDKLYRELIEKKMGVSGGRLVGSDLLFKYADGQLVDNSKVLDPRAKVRYKKVGSKELYEAIDNYIASFRAERDTNKQINQMFNTEYKDIDLEHFDIDEFNDRVQRAKWQRKGSLENEAPDKDLQEKLEKEQQEEKKRLKDQMDEAEKDSTAVINAIEEFYRLQESAVEQLVADGKMTREEADKLIDYVKNRKDTMLMNARRAIAGKDSDFEKLRKDMGKDMLRANDPNSQRALNTVQTIDVAEAAKRLQKFDGSKAVYDLNAGSFTQAMLKNAAQNELNIQRRQAAVQVEIDKILMQYEFVQQAQKTFGDKLVKLGLVTDGYDKVVQQLADGTDIVANTKDVQALAMKVVGMDPQKMYGIDENDAKHLIKLIDDIMTAGDYMDEETGELVSGARESFASMFPNLDEWMQNPEQYKEQMQAFYKALIDMDSDYYKALKQNYEQEKREFTERWQSMGWTAQQESENTALETQESLRKIQGDPNGYWKSGMREYGFADTIADDPEIARIKNRMEWRAKELEDLRARNASEELIMEKQNEMLKEAAALAEKVSAEVAERITKVQTLSEPLNSFGEEIGQKLGEMWQDISQEGKLSFGQMAKKMGIEYAKLTLKMASENLMKKVQQALFYKQMEMQEMQHQVQMTNIEVQGGTARVAAQSSIGAMGLGVQAAQNATEVAAEGGKATIMTMFGISEGASKIIATLGFFGIPLIGVITSILMGLLNSAKSTASQESSSASSSTATKTKLVSGMLTYDKGNVKRFIGQDGKVYTATEEAQPKDGLVTHPIATTVQGRPALVAENGPEIVVGRKTTQAIMMNEPELIRYLANYEKYGGRGYQPYDSGNLHAAVPEVSPSGSDPAAAEREALRQRLDKSDALMAQVLFYLQNPIPPEIAMYDTGGKKGLHSKMKEADKFMARYGG